MRLTLLVIAAFLSLAQHEAKSGQTAIKLLRTPDSGIQPQAVTDAKGNTHLIYYKGSPEGGDIFYALRLPGNAGFSKPLRVNAASGSAIAMGSIRGAQMAVGENNRVHVVWNGMGKGSSRVSIGGKAIAPLFYTRLNDEGTAFEPERNVITIAPGLDGGSSVAADLQGNVYVTWHAPRPGRSHEDESERAVFLARSTDEGRSFQPEKGALPEATGVCACCGMRAFADKSGAVCILFRSAADGLNRDAALMISKDHGVSFTIAHRHNWKVTMCPMSSASMAEGQNGVIAAWETAGQVYLASVNPRSFQVSSPINPDGEAVRKHPVAVINGKGETLLVWTEGTAWAKGGNIAWQVYGADGQPMPQKGRAEGLRAWSYASAYAGSNGDFFIVY